MVRRSGRRLLVFTMPTMEAGFASMAVPLEEEDGIIFDPCLVDDAAQLLSFIAHELARVLHPCRLDPSSDQHDEIAWFGAVLGPMLIQALPARTSDADPLVELALAEVLAA